MEQTRKLRLRLDPSDLLLEIVSIVLAILLATGVNEWRQSLADRHAVAEALTAIRREITSNRTLLLSQRSHHRAIAQAFSALLDHAGGHTLGFDEVTQTFYRTSPHGINPFVGEDTAWQLARGSTTLANMPYETRVALQRAYAEQAGLDRYADRLISDLHVSSDSRDPNLFFVAQNFSLDMNDVVFAENRLHVDYDAALRAVDKALAGL